MAGLTIRLAEVKDAPAITGIWNHVIETSTATFTTELKTLEGITATIAAGPQTLVAEEGGEVIGFATYFAFRGGVGYARTKELSIHLAPEAQGRGAGTALLRGLIDLARRNGVASLWAGISSSNPRSITFHTREGFKEIATLPKVGFKWGEWFDLHLLRLWLEEPEERG